MRPAKTPISRGTSNLIGVFVVCMKKHWVLCYPLSGQRSLCSDWSDVQADSLGAQVILLVLLCCGSNWWGDQKWATKVAEVLTIEISSSYFESQITYGSYESRHEKNCLAYPTGISVNPTGDRKCHHVLHEGCKTTRAWCQYDNFDIIFDVLTSITSVSAKRFDVNVKETSRSVSW